MTAPAAAPLRGVRVLVTRPAHQAEGLCRALAAAGAQPLRYPTLEITPAADPAPLNAAVAALPDTDLAVFVSANAVTWAAPALGQVARPPRLRIAAIGRATAAALQRAGLEPDLVAPPPHDSEAMLGLPALADVGGWQVRVFRGEAGGRELIADTLRARGAVVTHVGVYRRSCPTLPPPPVADVAVVTSSEGLRNLLHLAGAAGQAQLQGTRLVVVSARTAALARTLGFSHPARVAREASDEAIVEAAVGVAAGPDGDR